MLNKNKIPEEGLINIKEWAEDEACELLIFIVPHGKSEPILQHVRQHFDTGATILMGSGTRHNRLLNFLGLDEVRRDIILLINPTERVMQIAASVKKTFSLEKPGAGIGFTLPLTQLVGTHKHGLGDDTDTRDYSDIGYVAFGCILDRDLGEEALEVAEKAGAQGATVIRAHGSADRMKTLFDFPIEPEKDFLLMILSKEHLESVSQALFEHFTMSQENTGIQFAYPLTHVIGLYGQEEE